MRTVLQINKFLFPGAGAETVVLQTRELLRAHGHSVVDFAMADSRNVSSPWAEYFARERRYAPPADRARRARDSLATIYSVDARRALRRLLASTTPDVAHLHNVYHQLTVSVIDELHAAGIPAVMTLHDYKPICPNYELFTEGAPCRRCVDGSPAHAVIHRCLKESRAASAIATAEALLTRARRSYDNLDAFVAPSRFMADVMTRGGIPAERLHVLPNFVDVDRLSTAPAVRERDDPAPYLLFAGRLESVKGLPLLLDAMRQVPDRVNLRVAGRGSLRSKVESTADERVHYLGALAWPELAHQLDHAGALVVPSVWEENCPMVVLEAHARGCPVICSDRGGLPELVRDGVDGFVFRGGDSQDLRRAIQRLLDATADRHRLGQAAQSRLREQYAPEVHYGALIAVYEEAARVRAVRSGGRDARKRSRADSPGR